MEQTKNIFSGNMQNQNLFDVTYHSCYSLYNLVQFIQENPTLIMNQVGKNYTEQDLTALYNDLGKLIQAFDLNQQKKVS